MPSDDYRLPELPSDEELGIAGMSLEEEEAPPDRRSGKPAPAPGAPPPPQKRRRPAPPSRSRPWRALLTLLLLVVAAWALSADRVLPEPVPASAADTAFSSERAMLDLVAIARQPRPPGSPAHAQVRAYLLDRLRSLGLEPEVHTTTSLVRRDETVSGAVVRNVVARISGTASTGTIVVTAHYDSRAGSPGAGDDATGVAAILEAVRALLAVGPPGNDVVILLTDAEELGLLGARAFVDEHRWMDEVRLVLSVEMRGGGGPVLMFETGDENGWVVRALAEGDPLPFANSLFGEVYRHLPNDTDFTPFREAGVQGLNFSAIGRAHVYHQAFDTPERLDEATVQHHGLHLLGMLRELGGRDLATVDAADRVYFPLPVVGLVHYRAGWVLPLTGLLVLVAAGAGFAVRRAGGRLGGILLGVGLGVLSVGLVAGMGWGLFRWVAGHHAELGALQGSAFHREGPYVLALVAGAGAVVTALLGVTRRWATVAELSLGAGLLALAAAVAATFLVPAGAMNLQWPVLAGLLGVLVVARRDPDAPGLIGWAVLLALALPVLVFLVPLLELLWAAVSFSMAPIIGAVAAVTLLLLLPLLETFRDPNRWWAPVLAAVLSAGSVGLGVLQADPSPEDPAPTTLLYTLDRGGVGARWVSRGDDGLDWARRRTGVALETVDTLAPLWLGEEPWRVAPAPEVSIPPPTVRVEEGPPVRGDRTLRLLLRSAAGAEGVRVTLPPGSPAAVVSVNGHAVPEGRGRVRRLALEGTPEGAVEVGLRLTAAVDSFRLDVVEHHQRPAELLDPARFVRLPDQAPDTRNASDRAVIRTPVTVRRDGGWEAIVAGVGGPGAAPTHGAGDAVSAPDTAALRPDTTAASDTSGTRPDTVAVPDTSGTRPDTVAVPGPPSGGADATAGPLRRDRRSARPGRSRPSGGSRVGSAPCE